MMSLTHHHLLFPCCLLLLLVRLSGASGVSPWQLITPSVPGRLVFPPPPSVPAENATLEYMDPTLPPLLPAHNPKCSLLVLQYNFADTVGAPPVAANYTPPPDCPAPWSRVVLELSASASGLQKDRIAALWLDGAEILPPTTPYPMAPGVFWRVRKDVTRYTALLRGRSPYEGDQPCVLSMMLENSNAKYPGVYSVNVSLHFYRGALCSGGRCIGLKPAGETKRAELGPALSAHPTIKGIYREPADMIIPISNGDGRKGFWFRLENETEVQGTTVRLPNNTYRAVLEVYVSHHGDDEYWYANPLRTNGPEAEGLQPQQGGDNRLESSKANGGFRQVVATVDGRYVGSAIPFPVIYPGSVNPFFWAPVAAIGAYDHPSYDLDLTPFVGHLIDGAPHVFGLAVRDSQPFWLVSANLHVWVDAWSDTVEGALVRYKVPPFRLSRQADWTEREGKSEIEGQVIIRFSGWVSSSKGNITTSVRHKIKFKSHIEAEEKGEMTSVELESKARTNIRIEREDQVIGRVAVETETPLTMATMSSNGGGGSRFHKTKLAHALMETRSVAENKGTSFSAVADRQDSEGAVLMEEGVAMWGNGDTKSVYKYRDDKGCYLRTVNVVGGKVKEDEDTASCAAAAVAES
ncbi:peptide-N4-(N-acetyl-beta-glucosaminyl)asparagine amidase A-like [Ananas comosus]|uniref:Peptide-N4-(N-acetyl-beta- glucosaminyl)asparagine amidase A-like n=1 Tax=Ananas comosus TaxID=4615 RepID=A0A6P5EY38_ANACO|nr:peptide-N4-(N-acetyl-beta-glucosaminyl)asparagine amidase A-like [Ananas comosus]